MEKNFKVYIYPDGDQNTFYQTPRKLTGKYSSEAYFFQNIRESRFLIYDPDLAHIFFILISSHKMRGKISDWGDLYGVGKKTSRATTSISRKFSKFSRFQDKNRAPR